ncbi:hypothetical protein, partial [Lactiplantibacillus plantarum]|uniref:hypothetical protein n=2 Tax=Lactiplantibacillus plantarum TaxID=1590 RepID=UPI002381121D
ALAQIDVGLRSSNCHPAPEVGIGRSLLTNRNPPNRHVLIMKSNKHSADYRIDENGSDGFKENSAELKTSRLTSVAAFLTRNLV